MADGAGVGETAGDAEDGRDCVLVDSSAWISFFRDPEAAVGALVDQLLEEERVAIVGVVRAELLQGARSEAELERLSVLLDALEPLPDPDTLWEQVARLGYDLRRSGVNGVGIPDLLVAVTAVAHRVPVLTLDADVRRIADVYPFRLVAVAAPDERDTGAAEPAEGPPQPK